MLRRYLLTLYKFEYENYALNKLMVIQENCSMFHLRKKNEYSSYNLILINSKYIKFYYNIPIDKYEIILFSKNIKNSHYDNKFDYLYLFSDMLTIIKISDWSRILQIYIENDVFPLNSSGINNLLIKGFIFIDNSLKKTLGKYSFYNSKLNKKDGYDKYVKEEKKYTLNKIEIFKYDNQYFTYKHDIIEPNEVFKKQYLNIGEIQDELKKNYGLSFSSKKAEAEKLLNDFKEEGSLNEQYIQLIKILIKDNVNKKILIKYLKFLQKNNEELKKVDNVELYDKEIEYYRVCFTKDELMQEFEYKTEKDEKFEFLSLLDEISKQHITEKDMDMDSFLSKFEKIKKNLTTFNQPVEFDNKELYFYISKVIISLEILREKENKFEYLKNLQSAVKMILDRKLFQNQSIINDENKFNKLILIILRGQAEDITKYNLNLLNEKNYSNKEKEELISKLDNSLFLQNDIIPAHVINIQVDKIDNKYNFDNLLLNYQIDEKLEKYELYKEKGLRKFYESKIDFKKIKNFMKKFSYLIVLKRLFLYFMIIHMNILLKLRKKLQIL